MSGNTLPPAGGVGGGVGPTAETDVESERDERSNAVLLDQFYVTLSAVQRGIERNAPVAAAPSDPALNIRDRISHLLEAPHSWRSAYEIEQLQCHLFAGGQLETEITRRFDEAEARKLVSGVALKGLLGPPEKWQEVPEDRKRAVLHRLVNDLQWFYTQRFQRRRTARILNHRVSKVFLAAFAVLLTVLIAQLTSLPQTPTPPAGSPVTGGQ